MVRPDRVKPYRGGAWSWLGAMVSLIVVAWLWCAAWSWRGPAEAVLRPRGTPVGDGPGHGGGALWPRPPLHRRCAGRAMVGSARGRACHPLAVAWTRGLAGARCDRVRRPLAVVQTGCGRDGVWPGRGVVGAVTGSLSLGQDVVRSERGRVRQSMAVGTACGRGRSGRGWVTAWMGRWADQSAGGLVRAWACWRIGRRVDRSAGARIGRRVGHGRLGQGAGGVRSGTTR